MNAIRASFDRAQIKLNPVSMSILQLHRHVPSSCSQVLGGHKTEQTELGQGAEEE